LKLIIYLNKKKLKKDPINVIVPSLKNSSLAQKILSSKKPFNLFHTWRATESTIRNAIDECKSIDLDVCIGEKGNPYLGHSLEYHQKTGEPFFESMPLWEAVDIISGAKIPVIVDCKHYNAWPIVEEVILKIGVERCLVHSFVSIFNYNYSREKGEPDFITEWSPIEKLFILKNRFPTLSTCASCKWLPNDLLISQQYNNLLYEIRKNIKDNKIDTVCLNVPNETFSDSSLRFFLNESIIPHIGIDSIDTSKFAEVYIGETDNLMSASDYRRIIN
jgi:hypothetical protein